jgi:hypothetical protein
MSTSLNSVTTNVVKYIDRLVSSKSLPNVDGNSTTMYFVFEKVTTNNIHYWTSYCENQELNTRRMGAYSDKGTQSKFVTIVDGVSSFEIFLKMFNNQESTFDMYVAYATSVIVDNTTKEVDDNKIEMSFGVFLSKNYPITSHIGIFRNYRFFKKEHQPHSNLSMHLHAFSALCSNLVYDKKLYMITKPADHMTQIMYKTMENNNLLNSIWIGDNEEREGLNIKNHQYNEELMKDSKYSLMKSIELLKYLDEFKFKPYIRRYIANCYQDCLNDVEKAKEKLSSDCDFEETWNDYVSGKYNYLYSLSLHFKNLKVLKKTRESLSKEELLTIVEQGVNEYVFQKIKKQNGDVMSAIKRITKYTLHPIDPEVKAPVDMKEEEFTITQNNLVFKKPLWFNHRHLTNHLSTVMIDLEALSTLF